MKEKDIQNDIRFRVSIKRPDVLLFRNNVGNGYQGEVTSNLQHGLLGLKNWRRVQFGLFPGSADLIGIKKIKITSNMVGQEVGLFVSLEVKKPGNKLKPEQEQWLSVMQKNGAIAGVATSADEALEILK